MTGPAAEDVAEPVHEPPAPGIDLEPRVLVLRRAWGMCVTTPVELP